MGFSAKTAFIVKGVGEAPTLPELKERGCGFDEIMLVQTNDNQAIVSRIGIEKDGGYRVVTSQQELRYPSEFKSFFKSGNREKQG